MSGKSRTPQSTRWSRRKLLKASLLGAGAYLVGCDDGVGSHSVNTDGGPAKGASGHAWVSGATCTPGNQFSPEPFVFDVRTSGIPQSVMNELSPSVLSLLGISCPGDVCIGKDEYAKSVFVKDRTTCALLVPQDGFTCEKQGDCASTFGADMMHTLCVELNDKLGSQRSFYAVLVAPTRSDALSVMTHAAKADPPPLAWLLSPAFLTQGTGTGYSLTDKNARNVIEHGLSLGTSCFIVRKDASVGGFDQVHQDPSDVGPIAKAYPDAQFVVTGGAYNAGCSGGCAGKDTGPFDPKAKQQVGIDLLIASLIDAGLVGADGVDPKKPGALNVYADLGSVFSMLKSQPDAMQHVLGKLLRYLGDDNVLWATDALGGRTDVGGLLGWFDDFQISASFQAKYGYKPLTTARKDKILGGNAARLFGMDAAAMQCKL